MSKITPEKIEAKYKSVKNLISTNGAFITIEQSGIEKYIRKDAIYSFKVSGNTVFIRVFGSQYEDSITFGSRWEALKLIEDIAMAVL